MRKYIENLKKELEKMNLTENEITEIISDYEEMIEAALTEGLEEDELESKFGHPKKVAEELQTNITQVEDEQQTEEGYKKYLTFNVNTDTLKIHSHLVNETIHFEVTDGKDIVIEYRGSNKIDTVKATYQNNELSIKSPRKDNFLFFLNKNKDLEMNVKIPASLKLLSFAHTGVNASVNIKGLNFDKFTLSTTNGDIKIKNASLGETKWHTVNGDIELKNVKMDSLKSSQVSGDITMHHIELNQSFRADTVSGNIDVYEMTCQTFDFGTVSGDFKGIEFYPQEVLLKSVSGDMKIKNKEERPITIIKESSISGKIKIKKE
jgi:DUF4097 and DUF4098 domain-containing protein YvlB